MNVNLLPDKFYKNQALLIIVVVFLLACSIVTFVLGAVYLVSDQRHQNMTREKEQTQLHLAQMNKTIAEQKKNQSAEVQKYLEDVKARQIIFGEIGKELTRVVSQYQLEIQDYALSVQLKEVIANNASAADSTAMSKTEEGQELTQIVLKMAGPDLPNSGAVTEALSKIDWVYKAQLLSTTNKEDKENYFESDLQLYLINDRLPTLKRWEGAGEK